MKILKVSLNNTTEADITPSVVAKMYSSWLLSRGGTPHEAWVWFFVTVQTCQIPRLEANVGLSKAYIGPP